MGVSHHRFFQSLFTRVVRKKKAPVVTDLCSLAGMRAGVRGQQRRGGAPPRVNVRGLLMPHSLDLNCEYLPPSPRCALVMRSPSRPASVAWSQHPRSTSPRRAAYTPSIAHFEYEIPGLPLLPPTTSSSPRALRPKRPQVLRGQRTPTPLLSASPKKPAVAPTVPMELDAAVDLRKQGALKPAVRALIQQRSSSSSSRWRSEAPSLSVSAAHSPEPSPQ